jgi:N-acetylmuramoyl-L-alanine amidase
MANTPLYLPVLEERKKFNDYRQGVWGDSFTWAGSRSWDKVKYLVIHHSVTNPSGNNKNDVDYIAQLHKNRGWGGVGYHFIITPDGMVYYVGDISTSRANVADKNDFVIGICMVGDFTKGLPTDGQVLSAHDLCKFLINDVPALTNIKDWCNVVGHKDLQATQCPGTSWKGTGDSMYERIKNRIPYTPVSKPEPVIDWEKRFNDLKKDFDTQIGKFNAEILADKAMISELNIKLAQNDTECQIKIAELKQNIKNAVSVNPEIPKLTTYSYKDLIVALFDKLKSSNS